MSLRKAILECGTLRQEDVQRLLFEFFSEGGPSYAWWEYCLLQMVWDDPEHEAPNRWVLALCRIIVAMHGGDKTRVPDVSGPSILDEEADRAAGCEWSVERAGPIARPILDLVAPGAWRAYLDLVLGYEGQEGLPDDILPTLWLAVLVSLLAPSTQNLVMFCGPDGKPRSHPTGRGPGLRLVSSRK